ncbi:hypothetical protein OROHE_023177 [Orobanche hederae]
MAENNKGVSNAVTVVNSAECSEMLPAADEEYYMEEEVEEPQRCKVIDVIGASWKLLQKCKLNDGSNDALHKLQTQMNELTFEHLNNIYKFKIEFQNNCCALWQQRSKIVNEVREEGDVAEPYFWLSALKGCRGLNKWITKQDLKVLQYLRDISFYPTLDPTNMERWFRCEIRFTFDSNSYFSNGVLTKVYEFSVKKDGVKPYKAEGTPINWNPSVDISGLWFFNLFETKNVPLEEEGESALEEYRKEIKFDYNHFGNIIIDEVIPLASRLCYYSGPRLRMLADRAMKKMLKRQGDPNRAAMDRERKKRNADRYDAAIQNPAVASDSPVVAKDSASCKGTHSRRNLWAIKPVQMQEYPLRLGDRPLKELQAIEVLLIKSKRQGELTRELVVKYGEAEIAYQRKIQPLYERRHAIVSGATENGKGVPGFWLSALLATTVGDAISTKDEQPLKHLMNVNRYKTYVPDRSLKLEFVFDSSNPFFENTVLTKVIYWKRSHEVDRTEDTDKLESEEWTLRKLQFL